MKRSDLQQNARQYINGRWETGVTTGLSENPSDTREVVTEYARADRSQTEVAIRAAADAFPHWSQSTPQRRADVLDQIGSELLARREELGMLLAREEGKTLAEAIGEAARAGHIFKFFAGEALRFAPRIIDRYQKKGGSLKFVVRETRVEGQDGTAVADLRCVLVVRDPKRETCA